MKCSADRCSNVLVRLLRGGAVLAVLLLAALVQPAAADQFQAPDITVDEGEVAKFKVTLPTTYDFAVRFRYETKDGTAKKGRHYDAKQGHLVFQSGTQSKTVQVQTRVSQDRVTRDFKLALSEKQMFWAPENTWRASWAVIYVPNVPGTKTIRATIRDTIGGATGPE